MTLLVHHIQAIKKIQGLESAIIVFVPESNLAFEGIHQQYSLQRARIQHLCVMQEDENRAGIRMNYEIKKAMSYAMKAQINKRKLRFHKDFVCIGQTPIFSSDDMRSDILSQMMSFSRIIIQSKDPMKPPREFYSGKRGHGFDDTVICMLINRFMKSRFFRRHEVYGGYH